MTTFDINAMLDDVLADEPSAEPASRAAEPYITALPVDALFADHTYQRELDEIRVQKMAAAYRIALVGIVEVSERPDGRYAILDGQHRWATVKDVSFDQARTAHIACHVHTGLSVTEEAALYHQLNTTRRQLTGWDRWLARRGANDADVLAIEASAHRHGYTIGMQAGPNILRATGACEKVVTLGGIPLLDEVLEVIRASYGQEQAGLDAAILHGLGHVLSSYSRDELDMARLVAALAGILPRQLTARAAAVRELHKGTLDRLAAHVIIERYNQVAKAGRVPAFFDRVKPLTRAKAYKGPAERRNAAIREWAERRGLMTASAGGRIRREIVEAYDAAHPQPERGGE